MTRDDFDAQMARLGVLRVVPGDLESHREALSDIDARDLNAAVGYALRTRSYFPTPAELRADADVMRARQSDRVDDDDRGVALESPVVLGHLPDGTAVRASHTWSYYCEACSDMGWIALWCGAKEAAQKPWQALGSCGRHGVHGNHEYVQHCACFQSNPKLVRERERLRKYASEPPKRAA